MDCINGYKVRVVHVNKIIITILLITTLLITGCNSSYQDCYVDCKYIEYKKSCEYLDPINGYKCEDEVKDIIYEQCNYRCAGLNQEMGL